MYVSPGYTKYRYGTPNADARRERNRRAASAILCKLRTQFASIDAEYEGYDPYNHHGSKAY